MRYLGGKARFADRMSKVINDILLPDQTFVDLFCGSCNIVSKIDPNRLRLANDKHYHLIQMWTALQCGCVELPDRVSREEFYEIKANGEAWLQGFVGFACTFSGKWWGGYAFSVTGKQRNYCDESKRATLRKMSTMRDVPFYNLDYRDVPYPENSLLYCDIPYKSAGAPYGGVGHFDHNAFYQWAEEQISLGYTVLANEYKEDVPENWDVLWQVSANIGTRGKSTDSHKDAIEVLMAPRRSK